MRVMRGNDPVVQAEDDFHRPREARKFSRTSNACAPSGNRAAASRSCASPMPVSRRWRNVVFAIAPPSAASSVANNRSQGARLASLRARRKPSRKTPLKSGPSPPGRASVRERAVWDHGRRSAAATAAPSEWPTRCAAPMPSSASAASTAPRRPRDRRLGRAGAAVAGQIERKRRARPAGKMRTKRAPAVEIGAEAVERTSGVPSPARSHSRLSRAAAPVRAGRRPSRTRRRAPARARAGRSPRFPRDRRRVPALGAAPAAVAREAVTGNGRKRHGGLPASPWRSGSPHKRGPPVGAVQTHRPRRRSSRRWRRQAARRRTWRARRAERR